MKEKMTRVENSVGVESRCRRCGTCCLQGGPALHTDDLRLIKSGIIPWSSLITVRRGELVHHPLAKGVRAARVELVKLAGSGRQWTCRYFADGCTIYDHRPLACRALKCWHTQEVEALMEKDTLSRLHILDEDHPLVPAIHLQDKEFPCELFAEIHSGRSEPEAGTSAELERRANLELRWRSELVARHSLGLDEELFFFGRPYFQLLQALGFAVSETGSGLRLSWRGRHTSVG
jgi:Fe-S-cluster containining protein